MVKKRRVLLVTPEFYPLARSGELADVASSLPRYLAGAGLEVMVIMPRYRRPAIDSLELETVIPDLWVPLGQEKIKASVLKSEPGRFFLYFIDQPRFFYRPDIYGPGASGYLDNDVRFIFFNRAVIEFILQANLQVDVIHCHNWPTALIPVFLRTHYEENARLRKVATVFTIHNAAYQGEFPPESLAHTGLNWDYFTPQRLSLNGKFNFLKAGVVFADVINTVSATYQRDIQVAAAKDELGAILKGLGQRFVSIRDGIDYEVWNPAQDPFLAATFSAEDLSGKKVCKEDLIQEFGLKIELKKPLVGLISFFSPLKGIDLVAKSIDAIQQLDVGLIICGQGDESLASELEAAARRYRGTVEVRTEMTPSLMHKIFAGSDLALIPSREEPCGLNQFYGFRYGTIPVARASGGLKETIIPFNPRTGKGNGFLFQAYTPAALQRALSRAVSCYYKPEIWKQLIKKVMKQDYSWEQPGREYIQLYERAIELRRGG